jgi:hypothetical protein
MTLSTSDIKSNVQKARQASLIYLFVSLFCALFGGVYEIFGHGVMSFHMIYAFAFPLVLGSVPFMTIGQKTNFKYPSHLTLSCYHMAVASATVGCIMQGVLDIYGTTNDLMFVYIFASGALFIASTILYAAQLKAKSKK